MDSATKGPYLCVKFDGLKALGDAVGKHYPTIFLALEAARMQVAAKRPLPLTAQTESRLGITRQERRTAVSLLASLPDWFQVIERGRREAKHLRATDAGVELILWRKPR
jgi:hypothetical protein